MANENVSEIQNGSDTKGLKTCDMEHRIKLPEPQLELGFPLMKALEKRRSVLHRLMNLQAHEKIVLTQVVGYRE